MSNRFEQVDTTVEANASTGEVISHTVKTKTRRFRKKTASPYTQYREVNSLLDLLSYAELKLFMRLAECMAYEKNVIDLSSAQKADLVDVSQMQRTSLNNVLTKLRNKGVLRPVHHSAYMLDPKFVFRGNSDKLKKVQEEFDGLGN